MNYKGRVGMSAMKNRYARVVSCSSFSFLSPGGACTSSKALPRHGSRETADVVLKEAVFVFEFVMIIFDLVNLFCQCRE